MIKERINVFTTLLMIYTLMSNLSCSKSSELNYVKEYANKDYDVYVHQIDTIFKPIIENSLYGTFFTNLNFEYGNQYIVDARISHDTKTYIDAKDYVLYENINEPNSLLGFIIDNEYGVEKCALLRYSYAKNIVLIKVYDFNNVNIYDVEVDLLSETAMITNIYDIQTKAINGCNVAIFAASVPWSVGAGMVNPIAGVVVSAAFWVFENWICEVPEQESKK